MRLPAAVTGQKIQVGSEDGFIVLMKHKSVYV